MNFLEFALKQMVCMMKCANWRLVYMQFCKIYKIHFLLVSLNIILTSRRMAKIVQILVLHNELAHKSKL